MELAARLGDGLAEWQVPAKLESTSGAVILSAQLPASSTVNSVGLELSVAFDTRTAAAELRPVAGPAEATAEFVLE